MKLIQTETAHDAVREAIMASITGNTQRAYKGRLMILADWMQSQGIEELNDLTPAHLCVFFSTEGKQRSASWRRQCFAAINLVFDTLNEVSPARHKDVKRVMSGLNKQQASIPKQAKPLTEDKINELLPYADPMESALLQVQRDGLLRISEVAAVLWEDLLIADDNTGRLLIRKSKTDQEGKGHVIFLRTATVDALRAYGMNESGFIFPKSIDTLRRRIRCLTRTVFKEDGYSGHSCRVGMVNDLVERGASLLAVQTVGRWRSQSMPAHYARNILAGQNAVAQFMT